MKLWFLGLFVLLPVTASALSLEELRLSGPPAFRMTCLPFSETITIEPVEIGQIPVEPAKQQKFLQAAQKQGIYIGFEKVGYTDEDKGALEASCKTEDFTVHAKFRYYNYPTTFHYEDNRPLVSHFSSENDAFDSLNSLSLENLTINGRTWVNTKWSDFMNSCSHSECQSSKLVKIVIHPSTNWAQTCLSNGQCTSSFHGK